MGTQIQIPPDLSVPNVRYVGTHGSDTSGNGSYTKPYQTLAKALIGSTGDTTILIFGGVYSEATVVLPDDITISSYADATVEFTNGLSYTSTASYTNIIIQGINLNSFYVDASLSFSGTITLRQCVYDLTRVDSNLNVLFTSTESTQIAGTLNGGNFIFTETLIIGTVNINPGSLVNYENSRFVATVEASGNCSVIMRDCLLFLAPVFINGTIVLGNTPTWQVDTATEFAGGYTGAIDKVLLANVYTTIQEEGVDLPQQRVVNFIGAGVSASDDPGSNTTIVNIPGSVGATVYYLNQSVSQAPYAEFSSVPTTAIEQTVTLLYAAGSSADISAFQTATGVPNTTAIPAGLWQFYLHFSGTPGDSWDIYAEVYKRDLGGIETLLLTTDVISTTSLSATPTMILTDGVFPATSLLTTDRIVVKVIATNTGAVGQTLTFHTEGSTYYSVGTTTLNQVVGAGAVTNVTGTAPIASSGGTTPAISISQADTVNDGYLSSTDWNTFNNKQDLVSLTTVGTTGLSSFLANILNIPQYQGQLTLTTIGTSGPATLVGDTLNIPSYSFTDTNIYNTDGTLTGNRIVTMNANTLLFDGTDSDIRYTPNSVGGYLQLEGKASGVPRFGISVPAFGANPAAGFQMGMRAWNDATFVGYGQVGDAFFYAGNATYGLNFLNPPGVGTADYIRFYAGIDATGTSHMHIQGTGATKGYIGIGTETPTEKLDVAGKTRTTTFQMTTAPTAGYVMTSDASGNGSWAAGNAGTVTNVSALTLGTTGTDLSSSVATGTTTPVITLNVPTASAANRGALSSADWTTFNNKANTASPAFTGTPTAPTAATGTNTTQVATTAFVQDAISKQPEAIQAAASDETTNLTTGTAKVTFRMPYAMTLTGVRASLSTAQTAGALLTVDINLNGTSVLGTKLTFDNNEKTTTTAATPATIVTSALTDDGEITVDIDVVGTAGARGLKITLLGTRT